MKLPKGFKILSLEKRLCSVRMQAPFTGGAIRADENLQKRIEAIVSQANSFDNEIPSRDFVPAESEAIYVDFRALSKTIVEGYWIDWTRDGVLEEGVKLLQNQSVYPNHNFWDIYKALGSVSQASWDAEGKNFGGVPGINATYKIDALMNPRIARGLLWKPPYIHSTSLTVLFEFEFSHPKLVEDRKFWNLLGEEVDGEIVRLIVTKIREIWEASLVFQGADRLAKQDIDAAGEEDFENEDYENFSAAADIPPANSDEEKTMKLTKEQKAQLGIEFDGEDVPEGELLKAAESLAAQNAKHDPAKFAELEAKAKAGDVLVTKQRAEVKRLATLAELGSEDGELDEVVSMQIEEADADKLVKLESYYQKKVGDKFPAGGRSSMEDTTAVEGVAGASQHTSDKLPKVGVV